MSRTTDLPPIARRALAAAAAILGLIYLGYQLRIGTEPEDVAPFETVLAQTIAGHFEPGAGPGRFYGPFDGNHPSVLMHAPLYYRLVALAAWPAVAAGVAPLDAAVGAGRALALLGTLLMLGAAAWLARIDGAPRRSGWLAAALLAASPLLGPLAVMVRPDTLGVGLQTLGAALTLAALRDAPGGRPARRLTFAAAAFAAGFLVKQQNVTVAAALAAPVLAACLRGRLSWRAPAAALATGAGVVAAVLAAENLATGGRMWETVFVLPGGPFRAINYAGWPLVLSVFDITARRISGAVLIGLACVLMSRSARPRRLDTVMVALLAVEALALVPLCLFNAGAASNYALQAVVFVGVLAGRRLDEALADVRLGVRRLAPIAAAVGFLAMADAYWLLQSIRIRGAERAGVAAALAEPGVADAGAEGRYFVGLHHLNRRFGNRALIHDEFLYGAFEQAAGAEPRDHWLRGAIAPGGPVRVVIVPNGEPAVPGVAASLPALGYRRTAEHGIFRVWERSDATATASASASTAYNHRAGRPRPGA